MVKGECSQMKQDKNPFAFKLSLSLHHFTRKKAKHLTELYRENIGIVKRRQTTQIGVNRQVEGRRGRRG